MGRGRRRGGGRDREGESRKVRGRRRWMERRGGPKTDTRHGLGSWAWAGEFGGTRKQIIPNHFPQMGPPLREQHSLPCPAAKKRYLINF